MAASHIAEFVLLAAGTAVMALGTAGVVMSRTAYARLHFGGPSCTLGLPLIAAAVVVAEEFDTAGTMACLVAVTVLILNPAATHFLARALRVRELGRWSLRGADSAEPHGR